MEPFLAELLPETLIVGERTMVAASHRGGSLWFDLATSTTPMIEELGVLLSFGASEPHLVSFLEVGGAGRNPFVVVSGQVESRHDDGSADVLAPGELFGESGWLGDEARGADVFVVDDDTTVLALSERTLRRLPDENPLAAAKLHSNTSRMLWRRLRRAGRVAG